MPRTKSSHGPVSLGLGQVALKTYREISGLVQLVGQTARTMLRAGEDNSRTAIVVSKHMFEQRELAPLINHIEGMIDGGSRGRISQFHYVWLF